ncbi:MAG: metal-dependent hydrolase [Rubrobacter sp.]
MRTYSHVALTYAALRLAACPANEATLAALGAALPDLPAGAGWAWLRTRDRSATREDFDTEVCGRSVFRVPDTALHSFPILLAAVFVSLFVLRNSGVGRVFLLGWTGHLVVDLLTHSSDARPQFWPFTGWRFVSLVSYRESERHGLAVAVAEHALVALALISTRRGLRR